MVDGRVANCTACTGHHGMLWAEKLMTGHRKDSEPVGGTLV